MSASGLIKTYVVRSGRMTDAQRQALESFGPSVIIPFSKANAASAKPSPEGFFPTRKPVVMEIGFGMGKATWQIAQVRPQYNYLGVEVHTPGVGRLVMEIRDHGLDNLRIIQHDAVEVLEAMIPEASLAGLHIFYPDPWPKKRHHKRRLMRQPIVDLMVSRLAPGGYLYFVTDIEDYAAATLELLAGIGGLANPFAGYAPRMDWRPETKFEAKAARESRGAFELYFTKRA